LTEMFPVLLRTVGTKTDTWRTTRERHLNSTIIPAVLILFNMFVHVLCFFDTHSVFLQMISKWVIQQLNWYFRCWWYKFIDNSW